MFICPETKPAASRPFYLEWNEYVGAEGGI